MKVIKTLTVLLISLVVLAFTSKLYPDKTISEVVGEKEDLSTFSKALEATDLLETLKEEGPYTVFAPTNEAFTNITSGKRIDELMMPENKEELTKLLKYHVVAGEYYASDLQDGQKLVSLEGTEIKVSSAAPMDEEQDEGMEEDSTMMDQDQSSDMNSVKINNASVVQQDLTASNGIIHVVNAVLNPSDIQTLGSIEE